MLYGKAVQDSNECASTSNPEYAATRSGNDWVLSGSTIPIVGFSNRDAMPVLKCLKKKLEMHKIILWDINKLRYIDFRTVLRDQR